MQEPSGYSSGPDMAGWVKVTRSVGGTGAVSYNILSQTCF